MRITDNNQKNFKGALNNKYLLRTLEMIADHGATFTAGTSFVMSIGVRPLAINSTPGVKKENKQNASASSLGSALMKLALVESIALPVESAIKNINKKPSNYLKPSTIANYKNGEKFLLNSKSYRLATQTLKLGTGLITAIPKSICTVALIPIILDKIFTKSTTENYKQKKNDTTKSNNPNFKGQKSISKNLGKVLDTKWVQNLATKYSHLEPDIAKHTSATTDILLSSSYVFCIAKNNNINEKQKNPLIYNSIIGTSATLLGGYSLDNIVKQKTEPLIKRFISANQNAPKLAKYIEGINILRPAIIFASIYYILLPMLSIFLAQKVDEIAEKQIR